MKNTSLETMKNQVAAKAQSTDLVTDKKPKTIIDVLEENKLSISEMLPKHVSADKFIRTVISAIRTNDKLKICTPVSIMDGVRKAAQLGLDINTPLQQAYLIPYKKNKKINGQWQEYYEAEFQYGYRGIIQMVWQSGMVKALDFDTLCEGDDVVYEKTEDGIKFSHKPVIKGKRGEPYAYYATAITKDGGFAVVVMSKEDIIAHAKKFTKNRDKEGNLTGPWLENFDSMAMKTVIKALADKKLPKSADKDAIMLQMNLATEERSAKLNDKREIEYITPDEDEYEITDAEENESENSDGDTAQQNTNAGEEQISNNHNAKVIEGQQVMA